MRKKDAPTTPLFVGPGCGRAENLGVQLEASLFETLHELRAEAGRHQLTTTHVARSNATMIGCLIDEYILHGNLFAFQALHFRDLDNLAAAVLETTLLDDQLYGTADLLTNDANGQIHAGHQCQRFQAGNRIARGIRVYRRQRPIVAGVHGLEHIQRLATTTLSDHDTIRAHPQAALNKIADHQSARFAVAVWGRRGGFQPDDMALNQL